MGFFGRNTERDDVDDPANAEPAIEWIFDRDKGRYINIASGTLVSLDGGYISIKHPGRKGWITKYIGRDNAEELEDQWSSRTISTEEEEEEEDWRVRCPFVMPSGKPCNDPYCNSSGFCDAHDPSKAEEREKQRREWEWKQNHRPCQFRDSSGGTCSAFAIYGSTFCEQHDPVEIVKRSMSGQRNA